MRGGIDYNISDLWNAYSKLERAALVSARDTSNKCIPLKTLDKHHTGTWYGEFSLKSRRADYTMGDITYGRRDLVLM